ncbi:hypothetical protein FHG87_004399, partial [Trinorchestia longiramus]
SSRRLSCSSNVRYPALQIGQSNASLSQDYYSAAGEDLDGRCGACRCRCHGSFGGAYSRDPTNKDKEGKTIGDIASSVFGEISSTNVV